MEPSAQDKLLLIDLASLATWSGLSAASNEKVARLVAQNVAVLAREDLLARFHGALTLCREFPLLRNRRLVLQTMQLHEKCAHRAEAAGGLELSRRLNTTCD